MVMRLVVAMDIVAILAIKSSDGHYIVKIVNIASYFK